MAGAVNRKTWIRVTPGTVPDAGTITSVGNAMIQGTATSVPIRGWIRRVRADITAGTGAGSATVALEVRENTGGTGAFGKTLVYSLAADPLDQEEDPGIFYEISASTTEGIPPNTGVLFVAVATNNATADHVVAVQIDIEPAN
tara:strand:+ start:1081 stop:1509 length:429 start_codon:yes stop_codon:yes gene_type:complete